MKHFEKEKKKVLIFISLLIVAMFISLASAQTVVQRPTEEQQQTSIWGSLWGTITSPLFIGIILFAVVFIIILIVVVFILIKVIRYIKLRSDLFYRLKNERSKLAKNQSRYKKDSKYWWHIEKNPPIRLVKKNEEGELTITNPVAYYRGDYLSHEGNINLSCNFPHRKKWWIFPMTDILIIPNKKNVKIVEKVDKDGKPQIIKLENLPTAKDLIKFLEKEILVYADSISFSGEFFFPVVKDPEGKVIDLALPVYQSLKEVVVEDYLYTQTNDFVDIARRSMDINPNIRASQKLADSNQSVELPDSRPR